jgi:hypothetical protein
MPFCNHGRFRQQVRFLRRQFLQDGELPFTNVLPERSVTQALKALNIVWLDRVYSPLVTLWVFLGHCRRVDFRRGKHLSKGDHIVEWPKPSFIRSMNWQDFKALPELLTIRETRVQVRQPGFRSRSMIVITTLLDAEEVTAGDLAGLYRARWNAELDLRSLKQTMQMDILRCKTPGSSGRRSGRTFLLTISSAPSSRRPLPSTTSSQEQSASRAQFKHWKPFNP